MLTTLDAVVYGVKHAAYFVTLTQPVVPLQSRYVTVIAEDTTVDG